MHEFSLAGEVIRLAEKEAEQHSALSVTEITIQVGKFSGVEADAFNEALKIVAEGTIMADASVNIIRTAGKGLCHSCGREFEMDHRADTCPECGSFASEIKGGTEFRVVSVVIEQNDADA
jgi:hydrogenase nickel incorporation protein HypA/HybF